MLDFISVCNILVSQRNLSHWFKLTIMEFVITFAFYGMFSFSCFDWWIFLFFNGVAHCVLLGAHAHFGARVRFYNFVRIGPKTFDNFFASPANIQDSICIDLSCVSFNFDQKIWKNQWSSWYFLSSLRESTFSPHFLTLKFFRGSLEKINEWRVFDVSFTVV